MYIHIPFSNLSHFQWSHFPHLRPSNQFSTLPYLSEVEGTFKGPDDSMEHPEVEDDWVYHNLVDGMVKLWLIPPIIDWVNFDLNIKIINNSKEKIWWFPFPNMTSLIPSPSRVATSSPQVPSTSTVKSKFKGTVATGVRASRDATVVKLMNYYP